MVYFHLLVFLLLITLFQVNALCRLGLFCGSTVRRNAFCTSSLGAATSSTIVDKEPLSIHSVEGMRCIEVKTSLPLVGEITILEATAESQEDLVNLALEEETDPSTDGLTHADPYGAVLWPAATAVARTILTDPGKWLRGQTVCELGAGTGLVSLAAVAGGAAKVIATDYESIPLKLLQFALLKLNTNSIPRNSTIQMKLLDLCQHREVPLPKAGVFVAADVMYEPKTGRALAHRVAEALAQGSRVLIGDSPGRAGRPAFLQQLQELGIRDAEFVEVPGWTVTGDRHDLICGKTSSSVSKEPKQLMVALMELDPKRNSPGS